MFVRAASAQTNPVEILPDGQQTDVILRRTTSVPGYWIGDN